MNFTITQLIIGIIIGSIIATPLIIIVIKADNYKR